METELDAPRLSFREPEGHREAGAPGDSLTGEPVDIAALFADHHLGLVRLALLMIGDQAGAEDVVQEAFERTHAGRRRLRQSNSVFINGVKVQDMPESFRIRVAPETDRPALVRTLKGMQGVSSGGRRELRGPHHEESDLLATPSPILPSTTGVRVMWAQARPHA
ncbi:RNA polymerase sigma factor [Sphaerisporangium fuscum]|uniref:RNA polymerase sigma factor n=1 Tax=Sphaerisporangium fuscum TaxID=2835868 RepID=UPI0027E231E5|nr:sigma factor [Sphaerisporangium fuscum]